MHYQTGEAWLRRQLTREAIALAMQGRWEEAVVANRDIIEIFPKDVSAHNRVGKALAELGWYTEAKEAYSKALEIDPRSSIARRNLRRLSVLKEEQPCPGRYHQRVVPHLFMEEVGKAAVANLRRLATREMLAKMAAGAPVYLKAKGRSIVVENSLGEYLGEIEPSIGTRLANLIEGGNRYTAAITSLADNEVKVIIREMFQHPSQAGRPSFPAKGPNGFRSYVRDSILKYELEEEETFDETEDAMEREEEGEPLPEGISILVQDVDEDTDAKDAAYEE